MSKSKTGGEQPNTKMDAAAMQQMLQRERDRLQLLQQIAAAANEATSVESAFQTALDLICEYTKWPLAHVFMPKIDEEGNAVLVSSGIWFCDDCEGNKMFTFFQEVTAKTTIASGSSWLGHVFANRSAAWSKNVLDEPDFARNHRLRDLNVRAGFAFPVLSGEEVVALMEFYALNIMEPDGELLQIMANIGTQLGRVVERERAASKLRRREMLLAEAQSMAQMGAWEVDITARTVRATDQLYKVLGVAPDSFEFTRKNLLALVPEEEQEMATATVERIFQETEPWDVSQRLVRPDGTIRSLYIRFKPVLNENGQVHRVLGIAQDVTERYELERNLERSLVFLADAQRLANLGNWEFDMESKKGTFSDQVYRIHGLDPKKDELTQGKLFEMEHPDDREGTRQRLQLVQEYKQPYIAHYRMILPDGEIRHLETYAEPLVENGKVTKLRGTVQDVTTRKKAEEKIQKQVQRLAFLQEVGQTVASTLDLNSVMERTLETLRPLLNAEGVFILLREGENEMYFAAADHIGDGDLTNMRVMSNQGVAGAVIRTGEPEWITGDEAIERVFEQIKQVAGYITRSIIAIPLKIQNRIIGVVEAVHSQLDAFIEDDLIMMTAASSWIAIAIENARLYGEVEVSKGRYRELADELVWTQEEERRRISQTLHDDVGQGMIALEIQLELLQNEIKDETLQPALRSAKELIGNLTQHLLTLSYILRPPELDTIGLKAALSDLCQVYEKSTKMTVRFTGEEIPRQTSDAVMLSLYRFLQEALTNIAKHAVATRAEVELTRKPHVIQLRVADNGRGFETQPNRLDKSAGLGLLGMHERFVTLNGSIEVSSAKGKGTVLTATVPW